MKKAGSEKKKVRRSAAGATSAGGAETPSAKQSAEKDVYLSFAEKVRDHKDLESRWAVLQETRVEYFRGKDFVSFLRTHPEVRDILGSDKNLEVEEIGNTLLKKNIIVRCDRVLKTVRPGKKKLSTWPAHLEIFPGQTFSDNDAFFVWTFTKRHPLWQTILSFSWPILTLAICLFPVYPHKAKLVVLYSCAGILLLILSLLILANEGVMGALGHKETLVRAAIFGALWIILGRRVWIFPNILAEEATLSELFRFWPKKDEEEPPKWTARIFYAVLSVVVILVLRHHAPDEAARARYQKRVSNIIDDVLEWSPKLALSGMMKQQPEGLNLTDFHNNSTHESESGSLPPDDMEVDAVQEQPQDEVAGDIDDDRTQFEQNRKDV
ncbi:hypothetical protein Cgig2_013530 [Carnegiea gigantea]|uniref:Translocation protein SEC62 n=1 Tax=Carnegiea gigantea TaxID=171969 RepID=A0A9Q1GT32_9CARY|nr:hypothetical protein Cgig2_013530 [Carnegiea gigantea]